MQVQLACLLEADEPPSIARISERITGQLERALGVAAPRDRSET
jgi:hypothetical protein